MTFKRFIAPVVALALLSGAGFAAYRTQARWKPYVFPIRAEVMPADAHGQEAGHEGHDHGPAKEKVKLSPQAQKNLGIDVDTPTPREYWRTMLIPGVVVDRPGESDRGVTSKVAGVIIDIRAKPGDTVKAGDPLFTLQLVSEFLQGTQADLAKAAGELRIAANKRVITQNLVDKGVQSGAVLIEDDNQVKRFTTQVQAYRRQLGVFGLSAEQIDVVEKGGVVTEVVITAPMRAAPIAAVVSASSPIDPASKEFLYEVQELKVTLGEQVQAGQSLALLANHQKLYVEGRAFKSEADALAYAVENKVPVRAEFADEKPGAWKAQEPLRIHHLANQVDTATRTFGFYLPLENQSRTFDRDGETHFVWRYRPGQRVRLRMPVEKLVTLASDGKTELLPFVFPAGAIVREGAETYMFVQSGDLFVRKPVRVLYEDRNESVVANDGSISDADYVVRSPAAAINRALKAAAVGGAADDHAGHGHRH